jgi:hypothetical protein
VAEPEDQSEDPAEADRTDQKYSRFWKSNQSHEEQTKHNDESDGVACQQAASFNAKRNNHAWIRFRVELDMLPHIEYLSSPPIVYTPRTHILKRA